MSDTQVRYGCPTCGRFVAESAIQDEDYRDPGTYYGISTTVTTYCHWCGLVDGYRLAIWGGGTDG